MILFGTPNVGIINDISIGLTPVIPLQ